MKFGRTWKMIIEGATEQWTFGMPFTINFRSSATGTPTANVAHFQIYNLPEKVRNDLVKDSWDDLAYRRMSFSAGYESESQLSVIFVGNVTWSYSYRQGPDWITTIDALDGNWGMTKGKINCVVPGNASFTQILRTIALALPNVKIGAISNSLKPATAGMGQRTVSVVGNPWQALIDRIIPLNAHISINKETLNILAQGEYIPSNGGLTEITEEMGIIGSPQRQVALSTFTLVFEPRLEVHQKLSIQSSQPYSGDHSVLSIEHQGTISPVVSGDLTTSVTLIRVPDSQLVAVGSV